MWCLSEGAVPAQGLPAAFAHEAFGSFLDEKHSAPITTSAAKTVFRLVNILSHSYLPTNTRAITAAVAKSLPGFKGWPGGQEGQLMQKVRNVLLDYLRAVMPEDTAFSTLEPSPSSEVSPNPPPAFRPCARMLIASARVIVTSRLRLS